jgi:hypothetical protein
LKDKHDNNVLEKEASTVLKDREETIVPKTIATGNEQMKILGHKLILKEGHKEKAGRGVSIDIENLTGSDIGKITFKVIFYNEKAEILEEIEPVMTDFGKNKSRTIFILSSKAVENNIMGYDVKIGKVCIIPAAIATGNDSIKILSHSFLDPQNTNPKEDPQAVIHLAIRNISEKALATAVFDAVFYNADGDILDTVRHREIEIKPKCSRAIFIVSRKAHPLAAKTYKVTTVKTITTDIEKVHLYTHEVRTTESGTEEVRGILKNISDIKTDAVLVAAFKDSKGEKIGTKIVRVDEIEPNGYKQFHFIFDTPKGERIDTYYLDIGEMVNEN